MAFQLYIVDLMPESLVFSCPKILFLVSLLLVAVKDRSLLLSSTVLNDTNCVTHYLIHSQNAAAWIAIEYNKLLFDY